MSFFFLKNKFNDHPLAGDKRTKVCRFSGLECYHTSHTNFTETLAVKHCHCLPDCTSISYDLDVQLFHSRNGLNHCTNIRELGKYAIFFQLVLMFWKLIDRFNESENLLYFFSNADQKQLAQHFCRLRIGISYPFSAPKQAQCRILFQTAVDYWACSWAFQCSALSKWFIILRCNCTSNLGDSRFFKPFQKFG